MNLGSAITHLRQYLQAIGKILGAGGLGVALWLAATLPAPALAQGATAAVQDGTGGPLSAASLLQEPGPFVHDVLERLFALLQNRSLSPAALQDRLRSLALSSFDVDGITRFVAASGWRTASAEDRLSFKSLLEEYVMALYGSKVRGIDRAPSFTIVATRDSGDVALVSTEFPLPGAPPLRVEFRVAKTAAGPRIADLSVLGISLVRTGRDEFAAVLGQNGNSLPALMDMMRKKLADRPPA